MKKIYLSNFNNEQEKKLVMRIKVRECYLDDNKADTGLFLFESSAPSSKYSNIRIVGIKCTSYNDEIIYGMEDKVPNTSNIGIYSVLQNDYIYVYVSCKKFYTVCMSVVNCDSPSLYEFFPFSNKLMQSDMEYTIPSSYTYLKEIRYSLADGMSTESSSGTLNKLFYNASTKMIDGEIIIVPSKFGFVDILSCESLIQNSNLNEALIYHAYVWLDTNSDENVDSYSIIPITWDRANNVLKGNIPSTCKRLILPIHSLLPEGLRE